MYNNKRGRPLSQRNKEFKEAFFEWEKTKSTKSWETMFERVYDACLQSVKSCLRNCVSLDDDDVFDKATEATCRFMEKIKKGMITAEGVAASSLAAFVHYPVIEALYGPSVQKADKEKYLGDEDIFEIAASKTFKLDEDWLCEDIDKGSFDSSKTYLSKD